MTKKQLQDIEALAFQLIQSIGILTWPVDVHLVAQQHHIKLVPYTFIGEISGVLVEKEGIFTIGYNNSHGTNRQRFTIAHELGHYFLKHQRQGFFVDEKPNILYRDTASSTGEYAQEREANAFAAALLMPRNFVERYIFDTRLDLLDDDVLEKLARDFKVSTGAMAFRLSNLRIFL